MVDPIDESDVMLVDAVDLLSFCSFNFIRISGITKIQQSKYQAPTKIESVVDKLSGADSDKYNHFGKNEASR